MAAQDQVLVLVQVLLHKLTAVAEDASTQGVFGEALLGQLETTQRLRNKLHPQETAGPQSPEAVRWGRDGTGEDR